MVVEGALADAGPLQDVGETCFAVTVLGEERDCRIENSAAGGRCAGLDDHWAYPLLFRNAGCVGYLLGQQNPTRALDEDFRGTAENRIKLCRRHQYPLSRLLKLLLRANNRAVGVRQAHTHGPRAVITGAGDAVDAGWNCPAGPRYGGLAGSVGSGITGWGSGVGICWALGFSHNLGPRSVFRDEFGEKVFVPR